MDGVVEDEAAPGGVCIKVNSIGRRVTILSPLNVIYELHGRDKTWKKAHFGKNSCPTIASNTELLPEL